LIIDGDQTVQRGLKNILLGSGNNILIADTISEAMPILEQKAIGIILVNIEDYSNQLDLLNEMRSKSLLDNIYIILINKEETAVKLIKGLKYGAVDFITYPFNPNLIRTKIEVFKTLYFKDQRIGQLLKNIFPEKILNDLATGGKYTPKRIDHGVVLFTDFVDFSTKAKQVSPLKLINKLESYFTKFDEIISKYNLEKIKTIGDSYMALAGVTEKEPFPAIRACLAALEIRDYMKDQRDVAIALKRDFWEVRIGLHMGPLVAGIIGDNKYSFDVWGDTVNIASRAETASKGGEITITSSIREKVLEYFELESRGKIDIQKRGGSIDMFYLKEIKNEYCLYAEGKMASAELRAVCGLIPMDFEQMRRQILNRLKSLLPENIIYHDIPHTLNVEKSAMRYAKLEGVSDQDMFMLRTACLLHDCGFVYRYHENENFAIGVARSLLPEFGYSPQQIHIISNIINATKFDVDPKTQLEKIMCDADHDYLGRPDYNQISLKLRKELEEFGQTFIDKEWYLFQLRFLESIHEFHTDTAKNLRQNGKENRIADLRRKISKIEE
jgi:class 3 adenylate cyclase/predicted metal-dependent HD superfamily phosphohydrolase